jgi:hypothetical protein
MMITENQSINAIVRRRSMILRIAVSENGAAVRRTVTDSLAGDSVNQLSRPRISARTTDIDHDDCSQFDDLCSSCEHRLISFIRPQSDIRSPRTLYPVLQKVERLIVLVVYPSKESKDYYRQYSVVKKSKDAPASGGRAVSRGLAQLPGNSVQCHQSRHYLSQQQQ